MEQMLSWEENKLALEREGTQQNRSLYLGSNDTKPKPIIARFLPYKDCERILSLGHRLKDTEFRMYQDLPYGIVERRRKQMDVFRLAKRNKIPAAFSKSQPDKLYIRGKLWPVGKPLDLPLR